MNQGQCTEGSLQNLAIKLTKSAKKKLSKFATTLAFFNTVVLQAWEQAEMTEFKR